MLCVQAFLVNGLEARFTIRYVNKAVKWMLREEGTAVEGSPVVPVQACGLCGSPGPLCDSHIVPHFVIDWLRETSATGHIRAGVAPNVRVQDGLKQPLLCTKCEGLIAAWEKETAEKLFKPYHRDGRVEVRYGPWLSKFCASVSWRALFIYRGRGLDGLSVSQLAAIDKALDVWRDFMFGLRPNPGRFELHVLPVDVMESAKEIDFPPTMNRYLARSVETDVGWSAASVFVQMKMCKLFVFGFVEMPDPRQWQGTRVGVRRGTIKPGVQFTLPISLLNYLIGRAKKVAGLYDTISNRQQEKIKSAVLADPDRAANSGTIEAMSHDVRMFGEAAFQKEDE